MERCPTCHQRIKKPNTYPLSKNLISYLTNIFTILWEKRKEDPSIVYVETGEMYRIPFKGSNTANNTQLKYFGAMDFYYVGDEEQRGIKRSGKWKMTEAGVLFLMGHQPLPSYVKVVDEQVIMKGEDWFIDNPNLKWYKHEDYWEKVMQDLENAGIKVRLSKDKKPEDNWRDYFKPDKAKAKI